MAITCGTGQTNGAPLLITAILLSAAQLLHTAPVGSAAPNLVSLFAFNSADHAVQLNVSLYNSSAVLIRTFTVNIGAKAFMKPILDDGDIQAELILNGTIAIKVHADEASVLSVTARVDDQA